MGVLIDIHAANFVAAELNYPLRSEFYGLNSQCVLHWLKKEAITSFYRESS